MSMTICEDRHEPVFYEDWNYRTQKRNPCPVCEGLGREAMLEDDLADITRERDEAEKERERLQHIIDDSEEDKS